MALIGVNRISNQLQVVVEDANLSNNRIFVNGMAFDTTSLGNSWMTQFHFNYNDNWQFSGTSFVVDGGAMVLYKGTIACWGNGDGQQNFGQYRDTYYLGLDFANYPVQKMWKTQNGFTLYNAEGTTRTSTYNNQNGSGNNQGTSAWMLGSNDVTAGMTYTSGFNQSVGLTHICYEDVSNNTLWGIYRTRWESVQVGYITPYEVGASNLTFAISIGFSTLSISSNSMFFLGVDQLNFTWWLNVDEYDYSKYTIYKINGTTKAVTTVRSGGWNQDATQRWTRRFPSNIRRDSATRRVFYSSHYNSTGTTLTPIQYVIDASAGSLAATTCTMVYPGSTTYQSYAANMTVAGVITGDSGANVYNRPSPWLSKPHQFTIGSTNYISFWPIDMAAAYGSGASRYPSQAARTMMTYTISAAPNDNVLTYHSNYPFQDLFSMPRGIFPINSNGYQLAVPITGGLTFMGFNETTGWNVIGSYPTEMRMIGMDQTGRIWATGAEKGQETIHILTPSLPVSISIVTSATSYTYSGATIYTSAQVNAYGSTGERIASTLNLTIDGSTMLFSATSAKTLQVVTSANTNTNVDLTISGGGINNIIADVNV